MSVLYSVQCTLYVVHASNIKFRFYFMRENLTVLTFKIARRNQVNPEAYLMELRRQDELRAQTIKDLEQQKRDDIKV